MSFLHILMYNSCYKRFGRDESMNKVELLAPAGNEESLHAAVQSGTDAVYLGGSKFSARAYASNFDEESMEKVVDYCHLYGVKVYVTVNTLIKENEIEEALNYAALLYKIGVDALIIQDLGLISLIRKYVPGLELHASTQMTVHNGEGAKLLTGLGFKRIVLSRELSLNEIKYISNDLNIETEIFIHGALCICYSGQCLMSSIIGGRSGNRGRCAQPCRLPYTIKACDGKDKRNGYLLSPKDMCTVENIKEIIESGTKSLKIEGRMKRPEYVAGVTSIYRKVIDGVLEKKDIDIQSEQKTLMQLFNREGFSKAYLLGNVGKEMMAYSFPKNTGIVVGKAINNKEILLSEKLSLKDGIRIKDSGFIVSKILYNGKEVENANDGDIVSLKPDEYKKNDVLFKTLDYQLMNSLGKSFNNKYEKDIKLDLNVNFQVGKDIRLYTEYDGKTFEAIGEAVQKALKKPLDRSKILQNLSKKSDTPFRFDNIKFAVFEEGFIAISCLNEVRRELINKIENYIINKHKHDISENIKLDNLNQGKNKTEKDLYVVINSTEQLKACIDSKVKNIVVDLFNKKKDIDIKKINAEDFNLYLKIPNIIKEEFEEICLLVESNLNIIKGIVTGNLGIIKRFHERTSIIGDYKLNLFNSYGMDYIGNFIEEGCLSVELNRRELEDTIMQCTSKTQMMLYGRIELMVSEHCPIGSTFGGKTASKKCSGACTKDKFMLIDRKEEQFFINTDSYCRSHIYNSSILNLIPNLNDISKLKVSSYRIDFIDEEYEECMKVLEAYKKQVWNFDFTGYTRGHYKRGVE